MILVKKIIEGIILILCLTSSPFAEVTLPTIFSDQMVIQRDQPVKVWGSAEEGEEVTASFNKSTVSVKTDKSGKWEVTFPSFKHGGPYQLEVQGKNKIVLKDILIGDLWFCAGQSNMQMKVSRAQNAAIELKDVDYPNVRLLTVPNEMSELPQNNLKEVKWELSNSQTVPNFSAVCYFFGRKINKDLNLPIGLINSSWDGSLIQTWMSEEGISQFEKYRPALLEVKSKNYVELTKERERLNAEWRNTLRYLEPGTTNKWYLPETKDDDWQQLNVPCSWQSVGIEGKGVGWFRKDFELADEEVERSVIFFLGQIHTADETYLNGIKIGEGWIYSEARAYPAVASAIRKGKNVLAIKVYNYWGDGGLVGKANDMYYLTAKGRKSLAGPWKFKPGHLRPPPSAAINPNRYPTLLYNSMVSPITKFPVKGVLWYQGEQNVSDSSEYGELLPALINDWRKKWRIKDLPFLIVQLPNFGKSNQQPENTDWARLRESQAAALKLPNTALAVTIDLGEAEDIHPKNKKDVATRLALIAEDKVYKRPNVSSGPTFKNFHVKGDKAVIEFENIGSGLRSLDKYGFLKGFAIAGNDRKFFWAKAFIEKNKVIVFSEKVTNPAAVRYAWDDSPDVSLYNAEKLPAAPFRTDNW